VAVKLVRQWSHWWRTSETVLARWLRAAHSALLGEMPILAAGTALFAILAVVPTLAAAVAVYGLIADPHEIQSVLDSLQTVLPAEVVQFIGSQLARQAARGNTELGLQLGVSVLVAVFSSRASARSLIDALNRAYRVRELRTPLVKFGISVTMAVGTLVGLIAMLALLIVLPSLVGVLNQNWVPVAMWLRWPALLAVLFATLAALYRYAPSPRPLGPHKATDAGGPINLPPHPVRHVCLPGAVIATCLLLIVSWGLSLYVERVASSEIVRGAFGSVIVTLLWFYMSTIALVIGGFVNAELERHRGAPQPERSMY
jgi:membrane protein